MDNQSNLYNKMPNSNAKLLIEETFHKAYLSAQEHTGQYTEYSIIVMNLKSETIQK